jgi:ABC-type dipeptide/oligopeptide/nickel transport system permease component
MGLSRGAVLLRHALPNALLPVVTVAGIQLGALLAGAIVTEKIFGRPGLGTLLLQGLAVRDWKVVQGVVLVIAVSYVLVNLVVDVAYAWLDPRIRLS